MIYYRIKPQDVEKLQNYRLPDGTCLSVPKDADGIYYLHEKFAEHFENIEKIEYKPKEFDNPFFTPN